MPIHDSDRDPRVPSPTAERAELVVPTDADLEGRRFFVAYPPNWDQLTDAQKDAAALEMARDAQRQLGIEPHD